MAASSVAYATYEQPKRLLFFNLFNYVRQEKYSKL